MLATWSNSSTHTHLTALFPGLPRRAGTRKVKPIWILLKQETVSGSGISWAICKSALRSRQITTPAPHHSVFYRPDALPAAQQQRQSTEGRSCLQSNSSSSKKGKGSPYSITERRVPELIPVLGSQTAGDVNHKHGATLSCEIFALYIDGIVKKIESAKVGCYVRQTCLGVLLEC